jgi:hypothetical protein
LNVDLFGVGIHSRSAVMTAQRRVNVYYEQQADEDRGTRVAILGTPGLQLFTSFGDTPPRLLYPKGDLLYVVHRDTFYEVNNAGAKTVRGTLGSTSGRCYAADNGEQIMLTDGTDGYIYAIGAHTFTQISDGDFPGALNVTWMDGRFIVPKPNSGRWYISDSYDGLSWDALNFKNAESLPDDNLFALADPRGTIMIFGGVSTEFYSNTGAQGFPFTRIQGANLPWGLAAKDSAVRFEASVMALMRNELGQMQVAKIANFQATPVSTPDLEAVIRGYGAIADATAFAYKLDGHPFYQLNFPTAGASWLFDGLANVWSELQSSDGRHRAELQANYFDHTIVSDYENGNLYRLMPTAYTDNGLPLRRVLRSRHVTNGGNPLTIDELRLTFETGVGLPTGQGSDPEVMLRYSKDGGRTWSPERRKSLGKIGKTRKSVAFREFGQAEDFVFELSMSDPVKFTLVAEALEMEQHAWA